MLVLLVPGSVSRAQPADSTDPADPTAQHLQRYGMIVPRPVDSNRREALSFPAPRAPEVILAELDDMTELMQSIAERDAIWKHRFREYRAMQRERISLISELEESGYDGPRLVPLLETKLEDIDDAWNRSLFPVTAYAGLQQDLAARYADTDIGKVARWQLMLDKIRVVNSTGLHVAPKDYPRIAEVDRAMPDVDRAGVLLLEAARRSGDGALEAKWHDWIVANLAPETQGYRLVMRRRMFGAPIRLQGQGLRGQPIDTADWLGDVVLVDFWGTWCAPCKEAMPHLKELETKYAHRGLRIVGVLCDHELDTAERYLREHGYGWPQFADPSLRPGRNTHPIASRYAVGGYPTLWIIDRNGILREEADREKLEEQVLRYLDEAPGAAGGS
ncbi:MAG: TlpA family protein disulfide reductase [Planctomycetota bacterium]